MKKKKIRKRIEKAMKSGRICTAYTEYEPDESFCFLPLAISDELVYLIKDGNPGAYGYSIRSLDIIKKIKIEDESEMSEKAGVKEAPELDITEWSAVFKSLEKYGKIIIVENEKQAKKGRRYAVGRIEKTGKKQVIIRYYGPDTAWENKIWKIPYDHVTWVTMNSRYTETLDRYVPENNGDCGTATESDNQEEKECPSENKEEKAVPGKE